MKGESLLANFLKWAWHPVEQANRSYFPTGYVHPGRNMASHDLIYLTEGEWEIWLDQTPYLLTPDHVLILPAGVHHYGKLPCKEQTRTIYLHIGSFPEERAGDAGEAIRLPALVDCRNAPSVRRMFEGIVRLFWSDVPDREVELSARVQQLFCMLGRAEASAVPETDRVAAVTKAIRENPQRFLSVPELAEMVHLHPRTISGEFKKVTGQTIHQYQMDVRLQMAYSEIAAYPDRSFREIALAYGFYDEFHFSKSFRKKFGIPPKALRGKDYSWSASEDNS